MTLLGAVALVGAVLLTLVVAIGRGVVAAAKALCASRGSEAASCNARPDTSARVTVRVRVCVACQSSPIWAKWDMDPPPVKDVLLWLRSPWPSS